MSVSQSHTKRVLFFDSGMGGLSIYLDVIKLNCNLESYYLFDSKAFPYSNKSSDFVRHRVDSLCEYMHERYNFDLIVVACNTASTIALPLLRDRIKVPIVGVVPAIKPAASLSKKKSIALLATEGTVRREYTKELIKSFAQDCKVQLIGSTALVTLCEEKMLTNSIDLIKLTSILSPILEAKEEQRCDVVVLGCTHFPLIKEELQSVLGGEMTLVDSGMAIARRVNHILHSLDPLAMDSLSPCSCEDLRLIECKSVEQDGHLFCTSKLECGLDKYFEIFKHYGFTSFESIDL